MQIDSVDIDLLIPDPDNANTHDEKNLKAIRGSIKKFGMVEPLVVRRQNNVVLGGNGRLTVLKELGHTHAPVHYVDLDDQRAKALALALNRTSELSEWNLGKLEEILADLNAVDFDIAEIGFEPADFGFDIDEAELPDDVAAESKPLTQMTFIVHIDEQKPEISEAISIAAGRVGAIDGINENKNGNALHLVCQEWLRQQKKS